MSILVDEKTIILTGAGISAPSGLSTFRTGASPTWSADTIKHGHYSEFQRKPVEGWLWWLERFGALKTAKPNAGHLLLRELQLMTGCIVVTQNIDGLHPACRTDCFEVHGRWDYFRCTRKYCVNGGPRGLIRAADVEDRIAAFVESPSLSTLPKCPICSKRLRPHILFFEESYSDHITYEIKAVRRHSWDLSSLIVIGSTMQVNIAQYLLEDAVANQAPIHIVDPNWRTTLRVPNLSVEPKYTVHTMTAQEFLGGLVGGGS